MPRRQHWSAPGCRAAWQRRAAGDRGQFPETCRLRGGQGCLHADRWHSRLLTGHASYRPASSIWSTPMNCQHRISTGRSAPSDSGTRRHRRCVDHHAAGRLCRTHECDSRLSPWLPGSRDAGCPRYATWHENPAADWRLRAAQRCFQASPGYRPGKPSRIEPSSRQCRRCLSTWCIGRRNQY
jgi:hypothetical protein